MRLLSFRTFIRLTISIILIVGMSLKLNKLSRVGVKKPSFIKRLLEGEVISLSDSKPIYFDITYNIYINRVFNSLSLEVKIIKVELDKEVKA